MTDQQRCFVEENEIQGNSNNDFVLTQMTQRGGNSNPPFVDPLNSHIGLECKFRARKFAFTYNNYDDTIDTQITRFLTLESVKFVFGHEVCPSTGTRHLQGYMEFKSARTVGALVKAMGPKLRCFKAKGTKQQNWTYCSKDGIDICTNFTDADKPRVPYTFVLESPYPWQRDIIDKCGETPDDRTIHWFWDPEGATGKTSIVKHIGTDKYFADQVAQLPPKTADAQNAIVAFIEEHGKHPTICFIDIPRDKQDYINYGGIETIKNMCFASGKYKGGQVIGPNPHVFIFANFPPNLNKWSADRFKITRLGPDPVYPIFNRCSV